MFVACNKMDMSRGLDKQRVLRYAESIGATAMFTSAKTGEGVNELFTELSNSIVKRRCASATYVAENYGTGDSVALNPSSNPAPETKKGCCCLRVCEETSGLCFAVIFI